jgi:Recombination endonuclease VII
MKTEAVKAARKAAARRRYLANREQEIIRARAYQVAHPAATRASKSRWQDANPLRRHAMQLTEWAQMFASQDGRCYLCGDPLSDDRSKTYVDHDHSCCAQRESCRYCRRGLACNPCNTLIGMAADDPQRLRRIADNLEAALAVVRQRIASKPVQAALIDDLDIAATGENVTPLRKRAAPGQVSA